jgi:hypothetical protein
MGGSVRPRIHLNLVVLLCVFAGWPIVSSRPALGQQVDVKGAWITGPEDNPRFYLFNANGTVQMIQRVSTSKGIYRSSGSTVQVSMADGLRMEWLLRPERDEMRCVDAVDQKGQHFAFAPDYFTLRRPTPTQLQTLRSLQASSSPPTPVQTPTPSSSPRGAADARVLTGRWESIGYGLVLNADGTFTEYYFGSSVNPFPERTGTYTVRAGRIAFAYRAGMPPGRLGQDCIWNVVGSTLTVCERTLTRSRD